MTLQQIRYVVEIAKCGSMRKASLELHVTQPHLSQTLKLLEEELGITIFSRTSKGVVLTTEGKEFLSYAQSLLVQEEKILEIYSQKTIKPVFRFSLSTQRYPFIIKSFFDFFETYDTEEYDIHLRETNMFDVINDVFYNISDIGIIFVSNHTERFMKNYLTAKSLEFHKIKEITPCVFFRKGHPMAQKESVTLEEMHQYPFASFDSKPTISPDFAEEVLFYNLSTTKKNFYVLDRGTMINVLMHTDAFSVGTGILSKGFAGDLVSKPIQDYDNEIKLGWIKRTNAQTDERMKQFIEAVKNAIEEDDLI